MKTIELTIPTSFQDLGLRELIESFFTQITDSLSSTRSSIVNFLRVRKNTLILSFSALNQINFDNDFVSSDTASQVEQPRRSRKSLPNKTFVKIALYLVALVVLIGVGRSVLKGAVKSDSTNDVEIAGPTETTTIDRTYQFPFYDETGEVVSDFQYILERAELRDEVLIQGRPAQAINGKTFLVVYIKIKNEYKGSLQLNAAEYVRLVVNGNEDELLAPEMNSDPVQIQAISTKTTRIGFPIDASQIDDLKLQIGEIDGEKDIIEVEF